MLREFVTFRVVGCIGCGIMSDGESGLEIQSLDALFRGYREACVSIGGGAACGGGRAVRRAQGVRSV